MKTRNRIAIALVLALSISAAACKPDNANSNAGNTNGNSNTGSDSGKVDRLFIGLHIAVAGSGPLLSLLVSQGKLSQQKAGWIRDDFAALVDLADDLKDEVAAAVDTVGKLAVAQKAYRGFRDIYALGHFGLDPKILTAANIADGIFAAIVGLYGGSVSGSRAAPLSEQEQRAAIEAKIKDLERALAVK